MFRQRLVLAGVVIGFCAVSAGKSDAAPAEKDELLSGRPKVQWPHVPRQALAFYYGWYGNPSVSGRWEHWEEVEEAQQRIASSTHYPRLGPYRSLWEEAMAANPDWVLVTSWNEWHEGSEIEPSVEQGDRALKTTASFTSKFLSQGPRTR